MQMGFDGSWEITRLHEEVFQGSLWHHKWVREQDSKKTWLQPYRIFTEDGNIVSPYDKIFSIWYHQMQYCITKLELTCIIDLYKPFIILAVGEFVQCIPCRIKMVWFRLYKFSKGRWILEKWESKLRSACGVSILVLSLGIWRNNGKPAYLGWCIRHYFFRSSNSSSLGRLGECKGNQHNYFPAILF